MFERRVPKAIFTLVLMVFSCSRSPNSNTSVSGSCPEVKDYIYENTDTKLIELNLGEDPFSSMFAPITTKLLNTEGDEISHTMIYPRGSSYFYPLGHDDFILLINESVSLSTLSELSFIDDSSTTRVPLETLAFEEFQHPDMIRSIEPEIECSPELIGVKIPKEEAKFSIFPKAYGRSCAEPTCQIIFKKAYKAEVEEINYE